MSIEKKTKVQQTLLELRRELGLTQQELAFQLRVAPMSVSRWETTRPPTGLSLAKLADFALLSEKPRIAQVFISHAAKDKSLERGWEPASIRALREILDNFVEGDTSVDSSHLRERYIGLLKDIKLCFILCVHDMNLDDDRDLQTLRMQLDWEIDDQKNKLEGDEDDEE
jgi:transcriptional regulator with XRE-family HTH domain